jgi:serine phosphatase RsbU (regulator of sigma subunit)
MSLRTRLIIAFLLLSVVPLTAVTLLSYTSSVRAFETAAEREAEDTAMDVGRRMEMITADLGRRMGRVFVTSAADAPTDPAVVRQLVAPALGDAAALLERFEFRPMAPPPPAATVGMVPAPAPVPPVPPAPPGQKAPGRQARRPPPPPVIVDVDSIVSAALAATTAGAGKVDAERLRAEMARHIDEAQLKTMAARATREAAMRSTESVPKASVSGRQVEVPVQVEGRVVGHAHATLNMDRTMGTVLSLARRERGEIPFAIDKQGGLYTPEDEDRQRLEAIGVTGEVVQADARPRRIEDWIVAARTTPGGITFGIARPIGESLREIRRASMRNLGLGLLAVALALVGIVPISGRMTRHLDTLTEGVRRLSAGDYSTRVPVRSSDEFGTLAQSFNQMAADLDRHKASAVEQERLRRELELSRLIQTEMLPRGPLSAGMAEIAGLSLPAREVGGDFFNYFMLPDNRLAFLVGDVSGKGVSAALLMANVQATLRARIPYEADLARLADLLDRELDANTPQAVYLTLFLGLLEPDGRTLRYVNAGHHPQFLLRPDGALQPLTSTGLPIALYAGHGYREASVQVGAGDLLFFYTDGLVETENEQGEMFGAERLQELLAAEHLQSVNSLLHKTVESVTTFRGNAEPFDDATLMAMRIGTYE